MKVLICLPLYNFLDWTKECIKCISKYTPRDKYDLFLFNNASTDNTDAYLSKAGYNFVTSEKNIGFGQSINYMVKNVHDSKKYDFYCLMHNDIFVTENWLDILIEDFQRSPKCLKMGVGNIIDSNSISIDIEHRNYVSLKLRTDNISPANTDPCIIKRDCFDIIGYFDPLFEQQECDDVDFNKRISDAGFSVLTTNNVLVWHAITLSRKTTPEYSSLVNLNKQKFFAKHNVNNFDKWNFSHSKMVNLDGNFYKIKGAI